MKPISVDATTTVMTGSESKNVGDLPVEWSPLGHRSVWQPSADERARITAGANLSILVSADHVHPMAVDVTDERPFAGIEVVVPAKPRLQEVLQ